jgi:CheY-like chemotaxis protein
MRKRILIVEDEVIIAADLRAILGEIGHDVVGWTATGEDAVPLAEIYRPDLVLMDIRLRGRMSGLQAAQRIRDGFRIPVVCITASDPDGDVIAAGFPMIHKPFDEIEIATAISGPFELPPEKPGGAFDFPS